MRNEKTVAGLRTRRAWNLSAATVTSSSALLGALAPAAAVAQGAMAPATGPSLLQMVLGLVAVLAFILGSAWLARRSKLLPGTRTGTLRVVAAVAVGTRERVVVVEVGGTWLVLGVAPGRVNALHTLPSQPTPPHAPATDNGKFAAWLKRFGERGRES